MKISFVEPHLDLYGGIRRVLELSNRLTRRGHDVTIFHSNGSKCSWMECIANTKPYDQVLNESHDVLIYNDPRPTDFRLARRADARLKVFYVLALYDRGLLKGFRPHLLLRRHRRALFLRKSLNQRFLKLVNSTWMHYWLRDEMGIESRILIGGINRRMFHPVKLDRDPSCIRILCSGDPRKRKGTQTVQSAIEIARRKEPSIVLETYHGQGVSQDRMAYQYSSADIFLDGQWYAGWNNPVAEAMACGVPVICTNIGGVRDFAFNEQTALLVPPRDAWAMASAIVRLIRDKDLQRNLRDNALDHVRKFDWDRSAKRLESILESEMQKTHRPLTIKAKSRLKQAIRKSTLGGGKSFDKYAKRGSYHWRAYVDNSDPIYRDHVNYIVDNLQGNGTLLDIGCGDGLITSLLSERGFKVKGVDIERAGIKLAQAKRPDLDFEVKDVFALNEEFDYALASEVIEHVSDPHAFLETLKGLFRQEALVTTPRRDYYEDIDPYHKWEYPFHEFVQLLKSHFQHVNIYGSEHHLYGWIKK